MKPNWPIMDAGFMKDPMDMSGFLMFIMIPGDPTITEDGHGIL